jgi:MFS family permease
LKKIFYGWYMVGAGSGLQFLQAGLMTQAFGGYVALLSEERGWSKTSLAGAAAMQQMEVALLGPVLGWLLDRFGPRVFVRAGVVLFGVGLMALSRIDTLPGFYGCFVVIALGTGFCGFFPLNVAIIHWFERWRARAMSSMSLGLAFGGIDQRFALPPRLVKILVWLWFETHAIDLPPAVGLGPRQFEIVLALFVRSQRKQVVIDPVARVPAIRQI